MEAMQTILDKALGKPRGLRALTAEYMGLSRQRIHQLELEARHGKIKVAVELLRAAQGALEAHQKRLAEMERELVMVYKNHLEHVQKEVDAYLQHHERAH